MAPSPLPRSSKDAGSGTWGCTSAVVAVAVMKKPKSSTCVNVN
jgi:hypothetical protein